ncbi:hypothetical protein V5N11_008965 [Cardamine amara subsp. amara]|uniref:Uncharacterized protein n=1 Tax=Cardamine amara subsp. amara TaxID=228776 RepID=A0ABD1AGG1_CARAN
MKSDNDHVFRNSIKMSYDTRSNEWDKENYHSSEFKIDPKNRDSVEDPPVFHTFENITDCEFHEIVFSNCKELTYNVVKDICVDEGVPLMQEKFLFNETDSIKVISSYFESKSSEDNKFEECVGIQYSQENLTVTGKVKDDSEMPPRDVVATSTSVSKEDSQKPPNNNNIYGNEEDLVRETEQEETEEQKGDNLRYISFEIGAEPENHQLRNDVLEDSYDHKLFSNGFGERSFCEAESSLAHITYSEPILLSGSLSLLSDGSARSFAFPILQSECNSSPARMVEADKRQLRKEKGWRHYSLLLCCRLDL